MPNRNSTHSLTPEATLELTVLVVNITDMPENSNTGNRDEKGYIIANRLPYIDICIMTIVLCFCKIIS